MIVFSAITPHPPIIVPGIGKEEDVKTAARTILAMDKLRTELENANPDTIILISPHAPITDLYSFGINTRKPITGDLIEFGLDKKFDFENDTEITKKIISKCAEKNIPVNQYESALDHGSLVPLFYMAKNIKPKLVALSFSFLEFSNHYEYGRALAEIFENSEKRIAVIASGDLSHRLTLDAPAGFSEQGKIFDQKLIYLLEQKRTEEIIGLDYSFVDEAGECGLRSFIIALGILSKKKYAFQELSYEGPFGVGYLVAEFKLNP